MNKIMFVRLGEGAHKPSRVHEGDVGFDLYVSRSVSISPGCFQDVHTDIAAALPANLWGRITGRSSTIRALGLQVQEGIIDTGYRGELFIGVWNLGEVATHIVPGTRLAQILFFEHVTPTPSWELVDELPTSQRGTNGFGSTGGLH